MRKIKRNFDRKTMEQARQESFMEANQGFKKILLALSGGLLLITGIIFYTQM